MDPDPFLCLRRDPVLTFDWKPGRARAHTYRDKQRLINGRRQTLLLSNIKTEQEVLKAAILQKP